jgi:hypothetical protein
MLGEAGFLIPVGVALVALGNANNTIIASGRYLHKTNCCIDYCDFRKIK